ncbi:MAG: 2,3-diphosphoglycerate-dependent phosphoglycerate mutase [Acidimicrobiales bacterium]|nr:2,3-diphosphoglycerate-dependent phosphoglycerate mutase [Acidimicrobiales bacterium]MBO0892878.1 2,3-diphosphoglycerate-dependent phosphoglycerate mutase [Acidimicrobiales bacterium]
MYTLVLLRHGQSTWNAEQRFTGWTDVPLTERGADEARNGGKALAAEQLEPDVVHTSLQVRAIKTAELTLGEMGRTWLPVRRHWRLNERHYGALEGFTHAEIEERHGAEAVHRWRRSYDVRPPALDPGDPRHPSHDARYADLAPDVLPATECLADVLDRLLPYWYDVIVADLRTGARVLVVAHGNSLRAMVKHLERISDADIPGLEIPTGVPIRYQLDRHLAVADRAELR